VVNEEKIKRSLSLKRKGVHGKKQCKGYLILFDNKELKITKNVLKSMKYHNLDFTILKRLYE